MKIGILTQPLGKNYGGILQAYALQAFLRHMGYDSLVVDIHKQPVKHVWLHYFVRMIKRSIRRYVLRIMNTPSPFERTMTASEASIIYKNLREFIQSNIAMTQYIAPIKGIPDLKGQNFNCFIVGSDQVWRPSYSPYLPHYFLDFVEGDEAVFRIAYAASFGREDGLEFSDELLQVCRPLLLRFDAVSVREDSAVSLCKDLFGVAAQHLIDPTMLLEASHYGSLVKGKSSPSEGDLFAYILDESLDKEKIVRKVAECKGLQPFKILPESNFNEVGAKNIEKCVLKPVEQWIRGIADAKYVVTDSFHGCVFSIIFQKPFIAIGNAARGVARFKSLLKMFNLDERLVYNFSELSEEAILHCIDFDNVQQILTNERKKATNFLKTALQKDHFC